MAGLGKYFNSETYTGRANVAKATYASFALMFLYFRLKRKSPKPETEKEIPAPLIPPPTEQQPACGCMQPTCPAPCPPCPQPTPPQSQKSFEQDPLFKDKKLPRKNDMNDDDDDEC